MATKQSYAAEEAAGRVIPCVAPLAVDPVSEVRHAALAALQAFVQLLQEHSTSLDTAAGAEGASQQVCYYCSCLGVSIRYVLVFLRYVWCLYGMFWCFLERGTYLLHL